MKLIQRALVTTATVLLLAPLTACSSEDGQTEVAQSIATEEASAEATPEQLASIIAQYEEDWRAVIEGRIGCSSAQLRANLSDATPGEKAEATDCLQAMRNMSSTAGTASTELGKLATPSSMADLVAETRKYLDQISATDLDTICGGEPFGSADCTAADTTAFEMAHIRLDQQLDAWGPYL